MPWWEVPIDELLPTWAFVLVCVALLVGALTFLRLVLGPRDYRPWHERARDDRPADEV